MSGRGGGNVKSKVKRPAAPAAASSAELSTLFNFGVKRTKTAHNDIEEDGLTLVDGNATSNPSSDNDLDDVDESVEKEKVACAVPLLVKNKSISDYLSCDQRRQYPFAVFFDVNKAKEKLHGTGEAGLYCSTCFKHCRASENPTWSHRPCTIEEWSSLIW